MHAYLLGAVALALPPWVAVTTTVVAVLLLTGRTWLHDLARRIDMSEIVTAGQFLILTGIILPLLPNEPVTTLTAITPRQVWLALVVVCTFSYVSYLAQRYWAAAAGGLWMAALGGLYSSTATTVVLARQAESRSRRPPSCPGRHHAGHRDHVPSHPGDHRHLQHGAGAPLGTAVDRTIGGGTDHLRAAILGLWPFGARSTGAARAGESRLEPQPAGAWRRDHICGAVRRDLIPLDLGDQCSSA